MVPGGVVDAHHYLWDLRNRYPWLTDRRLPGLDVGPFARTYLVDHYLSDAAPVTIDRSVSGFTHFLDHWSPDGARPFVDFALSTFGPDRCLFGSNFPVERPLVSFPTLVGDLAGIVGEYGDDAVQRVFSTNARQWYRIDA